MNNNPTYNFSVDRENITVTVKRVFAAPLPTVWNAYTKFEILDQWWAPKPWKAKTKTMDFREGGHWLYAMVGPEGQEHWGKVNYQTIQPERRFTGTDAFTDTEGNINKELPESKWEVLFSAMDQKSTLVEIHITHNKLSELDANLEMGFKEGLKVAMEGLDELLPML